MFSSHFPFESLVAPPGGEDMRRVHVFDASCLIPAANAFLRGISCVCLSSHRAPSQAVVATIEGRVFPVNRGLLEGIGFNSPLAGVVRPPN